MNPWTEQEDNRLRAGVQLGMGWAQIARDYLPGRTGSAAFNRFHALRRGQVGVYVVQPQWGGFCREDPAEGSRKLLEAQLRTGQFNGAARAAWLARHGEAA